ncbi:MAG: sulfate/molybdate ABC transporter ATP-binding protein [Peptoniphilaceae bacterium]
MGIDINLYKKLYHFDLELDIRIGNEILAIIGESGSGKTMLLKIISGIEKADKGYIKVENDIYFDKDRKIDMKIQERKVGFLFQNYALYPHLTVIENLLIVKDKQNDSYEEARNLLKVFKIEHLENIYPSEISGGEKQRVALARMIFSKPKIILMDEPFSALDTNLKWEIEKDLIIFLKEYKRPTIFVTHNIDEALRISDKILLLKKGKVIDFGDKNKVLKNLKSIESAKLLGYKNFINLKINDGVVYLEDLNLRVDGLRIKEKNYKKAVLDSKKFSIYKSKDKNQFAIKLKLKYFTEDSNSYIFVFYNEFNLEKNLSVELNKSIYKEDEIRKFINDKEEYNLYYNKDDILFFKH